MTEQQFYRLLACGLLVGLSIPLGHHVTSFVSEVTGTAAGGRVVASVWLFLSLSCFVLTLSLPFLSRENIEEETPDLRVSCSGRVSPLIFRSRCVLPSTGRNVDIKVQVGK